LAAFGAPLSASRSRLVAPCEYSASDTAAELDGPAFRRELPSRGLEVDGPGVSCTFLDIGSTVELDCAPPPSKLFGGGAAATPGFSAGSFASAGSPTGSGVAAELLFCAVPFGKLDVDVLLLEAASPRSEGR
jgi:hypothetical protein